MIKASKLFSDEQKKRINDAVVAAESGTSAEIVPIVAATSGRYDRAEDVFGVWVAAAAAALVYLFMPEAASEQGSWGGIPVFFKLFVIAAAIFLGFVIGATVASYAWSIRRLFTPRRQMRDELHARAKQAFYDEAVHHTAAATGIMLYVGLYERLAVVLTDAAVLEKLGQPAIDAACAELTAGLAMGDATTALCDTIKKLGDQLAPLLPRLSADSNERPDALVLID